jgi:hypothetical protein
MIPCRGNRNHLRSVRKTYVLISANVQVLSVGILNVVAIGTLIRGCEVPECDVLPAQPGFPALTQMRDLRRLEPGPVVLRLVPNRLMRGNIRIDNGIGRSVQVPG